MSGRHPGRGQKIERLYAWVATEPDGSERVCSVQMDRERIESLRESAKFVRRLTGREVRLVCFTTRDDLETLP